MTDFVAVPRDNIKNLCFEIHSFITAKQRLLDHVINAEEESPFRRALAESFSIRNDLEGLYNLLALALDCAPDDIKNFFIHYEEICADCTF